MKNESNAINQADAQMVSIRAMVAALELDYDRLEELLENDADCLLDDDDREELEELKTAAGDCESEEDARQRIEEDALSVEVRNSWHTPGDSSEPDEFRIILCTGGPHVQIKGDLDEYGSPCRAWLEYSDWGTPLTERVIQDGDEDVLLAYCNCFYFDE